MSKRYANYRKICQEYYGYSDEQMKGMHVHHIDGNRHNNDPKNLQLVTPEEHAKIHSDDFILWSKKGTELGNKAFRERLKTKGKTEKEKIYHEKLKEKFKKQPLHLGYNHTEKTKQVISKKKKELLKDKTKHPMWGRTTYEVTEPNGKKHIVSEGWKEWCLNRNLSPSNLTKVAKGQRKHCKGYTAKIIND